MANESVITTDNKYFTFSGTEMTPFIKFTLNGTDASNVAVSKDFYLKLGTVSGISGTISSQKKPRMVIGQKNPIGISSGVRLVTGTIVFEIFDKGIMQEIQALVKAELGNNTSDSYVIFENGQNVKFDTLTNLFSLPPFDLVIVAVKENNEKIRMKKVIKNIVLSSSAGAIGVNTLTVQEEYQFIAQKIEPFTNQNITTKIS